MTKEEKPTLKERLAKSHAPKTRYEWYKPMFHFSEALSYIVLAASVVFSLKWYENHWFASYEWGIYYAFIVSAGVAAVIGKTAIHVSKLWFIEKVVDLFILLLLVGVAWNAYTDFDGGAQLAYEFHQSPTDTKTAQIESKITKVDSEIGAVWEKYRWKGQLPKAITDDYAKWGHNPEADRAKIAQLDAQRSAYVKELDTHQNQYANEHTRYLEKIEGTKTTMRGWSIGLTILFIVLTAWRAHFGAQVYQETADVTAETPPVTDPNRLLTGGVTKAELMQQLMQGMSIDDVLDLYNTGK